MYFKLILGGFRLKLGFIFKRFQIIYYCIYVEQKNACFIVFFQKPFVLDIYIQQDSKIYFCTLSLYVLHTYFGIYVKFH